MASYTQMVSTGNVLKMLYYRCQGVTMNFKELKKIILALQIHTLEGLLCKRKARKKAATRVFYEQSAATSELKILFWILRYVENLHKLVYRKQETKVNKRPRSLRSPKLQTSQQVRCVRCMHVDELVNVMFCLTVSLLDTSVEASVEQLRVCFSGNTFQASTAGNGF